MRVLTVLTAVSRKTLFPVDHMYGLQSSHVPELIRMSDGFCFKPDQSKGVVMKNQ